MTSWSALEFDVDNWYHAVINRTIFTSGFVFFFMQRIIFQASVHKRHITYTFQMWCKCGASKFEFLHCTVLSESFRSCPTCAKIFQCSPVTNAHNSERKVQDLTSGPCAYGFCTRVSVSTVQKETVMNLLSCKWCT